MPVFKSFDNPLAVARQAAFYEVELRRLNLEIADCRKRLTEAQDASLQFKKLIDDFYKQLKDRYEKESQ